MVARSRAMRQPQTPSGPEGSSGSGPAMRRGSAWLPSVAPERISCFRSPRHNNDVHPREASESLTKGSNGQVCTLGKGRKVDIGLY
jgi:hypothetical protein